MNYRASKEPKDSKDLKASKEVKESKELKAFKETMGKTGRSPAGKPRFARKRRPNRINWPIRVPLPPPPYSPNPTNTTSPSPPGPVATGILYAYLGCYVQTGSSTVTTGRALTSYQGTFTGQVNSRCSSTCLTLNFVYFGTVNQGTSSADCWCGNAISYVTVNSGLLSGTTGEAGENNCFLCNGGSVSGGVPGACGNSSSSTIAIFARSF
ncbi:hypothetical protein D6D20_03536 [Aureobasidium pullulans]|uniref:WSC domain-containing protein n=2 Tax=Aureobasidium pullulans TaxID=5580 RepID=A0A4S8ZCG1_AURPU|nr:hypothetical protein D6D20_03536 [Aureobasidium pullulans]